VPGGERRGKPATGENTATTAKASVYTMPPWGGSITRRPGGGGAQQRQQDITRRGAEELAPTRNLLGQKAHSNVVEI